MMIHVTTLEELLQVNRFNSHLWRSGQDVVIVLVFMMVSKAQSSVADSGFLVGGGHQSIFSGNRCETGKNWVPLRRGCMLVVPPAYDNEIYSRVFPQCNYCSHNFRLLKWSCYVEVLGFPVADRRGAEAGPPTLLKLVKKRWPLCWATSFASHWAPSGQMSGSATGFHISIFICLNV